jgi:3-oxoacid CoA-transferase subunit A
MTKMCKDTIQKAPVFVTGDIHGNVFDFADRMEQIHIEPGSTVVIAGDVGLNYRKPYKNYLGTYYHDTERLDHLEQICNAYGVITIVMRGNHDIRYCRDIRKGLFGEFEPIRDESGSYLCLQRAPHILFASDHGGAYRIASKDMLLIPGAYSVDKFYRLYNGWPWESEEQLDETERKRLSEMVKQVPFDIVISHTCPKSWQKHMQDLFLPGLKDVDSTMEEWLDRVLEDVERVSADRSPQWFFGHYHADREIPNTIGRMLYHDIVPL